MIRLSAILVLLLVLITACGDSTTDTTAPETAPSTSAAPSTTVPATTAPTSPPTTTAPTSTTSTTEVVATTVGWPGEPYDFWVPVPEEGPIIGVVGVRHDDVLNVRSGPGVDFDVIATLDPTLTGVTGTGNGWQLPSGAVWWEIEMGAVTGWANQQFLSRLDGVDDLTALVVERLGEIPVAELMIDLGAIVASAFTANEGGESVMTVAPSVGDLGEVTFDIVGTGDDSVGGWRLHIFGDPSPSGEGFSLKSVEATIFCQRGVADGRCV